MQTNITKEEALSLLRHAYSEPLGLLVYASEAQPFIQALYRAKREDPRLQKLQIRQTPEGIAICHDPTAGYPVTARSVVDDMMQRVEERMESESQEEVVDDETIGPGDSEVPPLPVQE